jgi:hypothetical protein
LRIPSGSTTAEGLENIRLLLGVVVRRAKTGAVGAKAHAEKLRLLANKLIRQTSRIFLAISTNDG